MLIQNPNPITINSQEYPYFLTSLSFSPNIVGLNVGTSFSIRMTPARENNNNIEACSTTEYDKVLALADLVSSGNSGQLVFFETLKRALQELLNNQDI